MIYSKRLIVVTGPSGAGKTTLIEKIKNDCEIGIPKQTTTRLPRDDDDKNLYRYISIEKFIEDQKNKKFAISSGKHKRRYGFYKSDIMSELEKYDTIFLVVSYKEIKQIKKLRMDVDIVTLTFSKNIESYVKNRIKERNVYYDPLDLEIRARYAKYEHDKYFANIYQESDIIIYTDLHGINEMTEIVKNRLNLRDKNREDEIVI